MTTHIRNAAFLGYEEVRLVSVPEYNRYTLYFYTDEIEFNSHDDLYIPPILNKADFILLLLYDFDLTSYNSLRPTKVIYTDFYFNAKNKGVMNNR